MKRRLSNSFRVISLLLVLLMLPILPFDAFAVQETAAQTTKTVPTSMDTTLASDAYSCTYTDQWVPMFPTGKPDGGTWPAWDDSHYASIVTAGYEDIGALHLKSTAGKNTGVAINAGMSAGSEYVLGLWVKGTSNSGKVLALYANSDPVIIGEHSNLTANWSYYEITFTASGSQLNILAPDWGETDIYIDNITLKKKNWLITGSDILAGKGDFCHQIQVPVNYVPATINTNKVSDAYTCRYSDCWVPMFPTGKPSDGTWDAWDSNHYAEIVEAGYADVGALHMKSIPHHNTGVAINPCMTPGEQYTLGMWVKGTSDSGRVLALYANGDPVIIQMGSDLTADWSYYEITFTASLSQLNLVCADWGNSELYIDNITLTNASGEDLLAGCGDFCVKESTAVEDANLDFELTASGVPVNWSFKNVLAEGSATLYTENVYNGNQSLRMLREEGQLDCSFLYSQSLIPVSYGDEIEFVANISSRNCISGSFSMFVLGFGENDDSEMVDFAYGQERITNAGSSWSQWDSYSLLYTVPAGVKYLQLALRVGGAEADVLVDDIAYYNYTENYNTIYTEEFEAPSVTTGLPGGWVLEEGTASVDAKGQLTVSGDANAQISTKLYSLRTGYTYALTADAAVDGTARGKVTLEGVNWKGESIGAVVALNLSSGELKTEFVAKSAVYYRLIVEKTGGSGSISVDNIVLQMTEEPVKSTSQTAAPEITTVTTEPTTTSSVETIGGKTYMIVNGEAVAPMWYARPENPILFEEHTVTKFAEVGVDTLVTYVFLNNNYGDVWTEEGFVSDAIDDMMLANLKGNPNAKFIVALDFNAPQWWCEQNPGELATLASTTPDRTNASFASQKWKQESGAIMAEAIDYMMHQSYANQIIGFKITGGYTLEWNWWASSGVSDDVGDFSQCGIEGFRAWLTEKYQTDAALQAAYSDSSITLKNAMPPSAALRSDDYLDTVITVQDHPQMMDYELYMAQVKADTIEYFAELVKDAVNDRLVVGTYGGYFYAGGGYEFSNAVANVYFQRILQSEYIDFVKSPWMYGMREIGDSAEFMGPVDSLDLYGKLWIVEDDTRLNLQKMYGKQDDNAAVGWTRDYEQSVEQLKRNFSYVLSKGMGVSFYNLMWNFTDDDQYYGVIGQMYQEMQASLCRVDESTADIAVFVDGESHMLVPYEEEFANSILGTSLYRSQLTELGHTGAAYDMYLLDDLKDGLVPEHKINVFLAATMITQEERAAIESQLQKNGNILVWIFTDGISDGNTTDITLMEELTGMDLSLISTTRKHNATAKVTDNTHWLTAGMKASQYYGVKNYDKMSPVIAVKDSAATVLAYHTPSGSVSSGQAALAVKDMGDWTSIYSAVPNLPQSLFRNMLKQVGGHIYTDSASDVIYASRNYVALHSLFAGERTITLPEKVSVYDVFSGKLIGTGIDSFTVTLAGKQTHLFRLSKAQAELLTVDASAMTGAYTAPGNAWTPMYPTGSPDSGTWPAWSDDHYVEVVPEGYRDPGALHMKSYYYKNAGVAIDVGMEAGQTYTIGLWAKGTTDAGRVLALYANGNPAIIPTVADMAGDWQYYEATFTAEIAQVNLMVADWGNTDLYADHITLKNASGEDLLAGYGDFYRINADAQAHNWIAPSCTAPQTCAGCGMTSGEAVGHSYGSWTVTKPATLTASGIREKTCESCGDRVTEEIPCLAGDVEGWSLTLGDDLHLNFKMRIHEDIRETAQVVITVADKSYSHSVSSGSYDEVTDTYLFGVDVAAAQMTDLVTLQILNGTDASVTKTYTVQQYARALLADETMSAYHNLVTQMLRYGGAAQAYFGYRTQEMADAGITGGSPQSVPETAGQDIKVSGSAEGIRFYGASLVFESRIAVRYYFAVTGDIDAYTFGSDLTPVQAGEYYYVELPGMNPQELDGVTKVSVTDSGGNAMTVSYSPMHYIVRMSKKGSEPLQMLMQAMYCYHLAAKTVCTDLP